MDFTEPLYKDNSDYGDENRILSRQCNDSGCIQPSRPGITEALLLLFSGQPIPDLRTR